ncbi:hypothetical protein QEG98_05985 [Myxococcus sp. MxC21-1]|uniref:hypothetical protein n=1 Tax=Myxococcus sp. MxC21-1 TaxID=3041439 RepID=UPI00292EE85D|nr:hypothetical protein [Myxococcus sp. MxC21-1]WNZ66182.1 hypothetical protein QEG98_05985 [Myxococcus sp. MxC21-1]
MGALGGLMSGQEGGAGGMLSALGGAAGQAGDVAAVVSLLGRFNIDASKASLVAPLLLNFLKSRLDPALVGRILSVVPLLAGAGGGGNTPGGGGLGGCWAGCWAADAEAPHRQRPVTRWRKVVASAHSGKPST